MLDETKHSSAKEKSTIITRTLPFLNWLLLAQEVTSGYPRVGHFLVPLPPKTCTDWDPSSLLTKTLPQAKCEL